MLGYTSSSFDAANEERLRKHSFRKLHIVLRRMCRAVKLIARVLNTLYQARQWIK